MSCIQEVNAGSIRSRPRWCHQMESLSALLALCERNSPHKGQWREGWMLLWSVPEQMVEYIIETPVIWDAIALITTSPQRIIFWRFKVSNNLSLSKNYHKIVLYISIIPFDFKQLQQSVLYMDTCFKVSNDLRYKYWTSATLCTWEINLSTIISLTTHD